jgi:hypothetical protein
MRVLSGIRQSRVRIAAAESAAVLALFAVGIGVAPTASASAAAPQARSLSQRPLETVGPVYAGTYGSQADCINALLELAAGLQGAWAGGYCNYVGGVGTRRTTSTPFPSVPRQQAPLPGATKPPPPADGSQYT